MRAGPAVEWLITARAVQGAGAALVMPLAVALLGAGVPAEERGRALGVFEGLTGLATIAGPLVGGAVAQLAGWQWIFWVNVPIAVLLIVALGRWVRKATGRTAARHRRNGPCDSGCVRAGLGSRAGNDAGWTRPEVLGALGGSAVLLAGFLVRQRRASAPLVPLGMFRSRGFAAGTVVSLLLFAALYGSVFFLAQFLQAGQGHSPFAAGLRLVPWTATLLVVAPVAGLLADRTGDRPVLVGGLVLNAVGLAWIAVIAAPDLAYARLVVPLVVTGIGASMAIPVVQNVVLGAVAPAAIGKASGANAMTQELGGALGRRGARSGVHAAAASGFVAGFTTAMGVCAALVGAAAAAALAVPRNRTPAEPEAPVEIRGVC